MEQVADHALEEQDWFVVLPDHDATSDVVSGLPEAPCRVAHPSGRPWLVGRWDTDDLRVGEANGVRLAVLGCCSAEQGRLDEFAARLDDPRGASRVCGGLAGSFHVLTSVNGRTSAHGTVSGLRRVFHTRTGGVTVAADRMDVLARLTGAGLDERALALRLLVLSDFMPYDQDQPMWSGVSAVEDDSVLIIDQDGRSDIRRRWWPPDPVLTLDDGAAVLRSTLTKAVAARIDSGRRLSADLSGGLDSTSLCYLAARDDRSLITFTSSCGVDDDDDPLWADRAAEGLVDRIRRVVVLGPEMPAHYSDLNEPGPAMDEPFPGIGDRPDYRLIAQHLSSLGARLHLTGEGGDEVLQDYDGYLADLLRTRPLLGVTRLWTHRTVNRHPGRHFFARSGRGATNAVSCCPWPPP